MRGATPHRSSHLAALGSALATLSLALFAGCGLPAAGESCPGDDSDQRRPEGWTVETHCKGQTPNYALIFDDTAVQRITIEISAASRQASLDDLDEKFSGGGLTGDLDALPNPIWVQATVRHGEHEWTRVGMRYKGHSSLKGPWQSGIRKLSFILDFDHYEDEHESIDNQRFYGFNRLAFSNGYNDPSFLREKVASEVFRAAGVPAARSGFAAISLDWGEGPQYLGLYTMVEAPCDNLRASQLGDEAKAGALYKPWSDAARWLNLDTIPMSEVAETFEACGDDDPKAGDDVKVALERLHQDRSDAASWRSGLEEVFNVEAFLKTLAVGRVMMNWDSYGCMHHNYFVYVDPNDQNRLRWFPWDLNETMLDREQAGCPAPGSVFLDELVNGAEGIDTDWPLVRFLLADDTYRQRYRSMLRETLDGPFAQASLVERFRRYHALISPYVIGPEGVEKYPYSNTSAEDFQSSLVGGASALETHVAERHKAVEAALAAEP